jgi:hypothetical protein
VSLAGVVVVVASVLVLVVVLVVEEDPPLSLPPHATVNVPAAIAAAIPATTEKRRGIRVSVMVILDSCEIGDYSERCTHSDPKSSAMAPTGCPARTALEFGK